MLDASATLACCFEDEGGRLAELVLAALEVREALAPPIWPAEVGNAILVAERRGRIETAAVARAVELIRGLAVRITDDGVGADPHRLITLARSYNLSAYDATYLALAMREGLPLATLDSALKRAARKTGVPLLGE